MKEQIDLHRAQIADSIVAELNAQFLSNKVDKDGKKSGVPDSVILNHLSMIVDSNIRGNMELVDEWNNSPNLRGLVDAATKEYAGTGEKAEYRDAMASFYNQMTRLSVMVEKGREELMRNVRESQNIKEQNDA